MRRLVALLILVVVAAAGFAVYSRRNGPARPGDTGSAAAVQERTGPRGGASRGSGGPMGRGRGGPRPPLTVGTASVSRAAVAEYITVVGNLIGMATVQVVPKVSGRLESISVRLADPVRRGQVIAKIEDREIQQQVKQAEASYEVAAATIRQREADLKLAGTSLDRTRSLFDRQLMPRQTLDDAEARYQAAQAQLDLARAQFQQAKARLDELRITLANTEIVSPVTGFVGKRFLDPGAFASQNAAVVSVVDISSVRLVANLVEKDVKRVTRGTPAEVEVDAFPGERFGGHVSRVAPVFDPATRTAEMEIEVPNPTLRLKPGMYARVRLRVAEHAGVLTVPLNAVVDVSGRKGVFVPDGNIARFVPVEVGLQDQERVEIVNGLAEGATVISTGAAGLRDGDPVVLAAELGSFGATDAAGRPGAGATGTTGPGRPRRGSGARGRPGTGGPSR